MREMKQPRFSIHDAFEEENDEAIRVYGSTVVSNVPRPANSGTGNNSVGSSGGSGSSGGGGVNNVGSTTTNELSVTCDPRSVAQILL